MFSIMSQIKLSLRYNGIQKASSAFRFTNLFGIVGDDTPKQFPRTKGDCTVKIIRNAQSLSTTLVVSDSALSSSLAIKWNSAINTDVFIYCSVVFSKRIYCDKAELNNFRH